jgi:hypothetical protein
VDRRLSEFPAQGATRGDASIAVRPVFAATTASWTEADLTHDTARGLEGDPAASVVTVAGDDNSAGAS